MKIVKYILGVTIMGMGVSILHSHFGVADKPFIERCFDFFVTVGLSIVIAYGAKLTNWDDGK